MKKLLLLACIVLTSSNQSRGSIIPTSLGIVYGYTSTTLVLKSIIKNKDLINRQNKFIQCLISLPVVTIPAGLQVVLGKIFFSSTNAGHNIYGFCNSRSLSCNRKINTFRQPRTSTFYQS